MRDEGWKEDEDDDDAVDEDDMRRYPTSDEVAVKAYQLSQANPNNPADQNWYEAERWLVAQRWLVGAPGFAPRFETR